MVLDAWSAVGPDADAPDLEMVGAQHAEVVRCALALLRTWPDGTDPDAGGCEVVLGTDGGSRHLVRTVPDPHGDRLALSVVVDGPPRVLDRIRKRLRSVSVDALTAGPSMTRRPVLGGWSFAMLQPDVPASPPVDPRPGGGPARDDEGRVALPVPRDGRPAPALLTPPRGRPPGTGPSLTPPNARRPGAPTDAPRRPSPPVALPAPAPPRAPTS
jgi:hypothetical protein